MQAGVEPSVGSVGDSDDNALAETINGLYKAEIIHRRGPWRSLEAVEFATLEWVDWFNNGGSWSPSETSRRPKPRNVTTPCWNNLPWRRDPNQMASDERFKKARRTRGGNAPPPRLSLWRRPCPGGRPRRPGAQKLIGDGDGSSNQEQRCSDSYQCEKPDPVQNYLFVHFSSAHPF